MPLSWARLVAVAVTAAVSLGLAPPAPRTVDDPAVTSRLAWHLDAIGARTAWRAAVGLGVTVAIVDSGVDLGHPDLLGQVVGSVSCLGAAGDPARCVANAGNTDHDGHGTHIAGLVAARADNGLGVAGVAPRARILAIRALHSGCGAPGCLPSGEAADVAAGVRYATAHGAAVINLSLTAVPLGTELAAAIAEAWSTGVITVLAAGNHGGVGRFRGSSRALVVTATDRSGRRAPYAADLTGVALGVAAPGGNSGDTLGSCHMGGSPVGIVSTYARREGDGSGYTCLAGTSMAVPQVSGALALLLSMGYDRDAALERLLDTARPGPGLGAGSIDLTAAVAGPLPHGVRARIESLDNGRPADPVAAAASGPFAPDQPAPQPLDGVPRWLLMVVGGLSAGLAADLFLRITAPWRHRRRRARLPR